MADLKFVQITAAAATENFAHIYALDETGQVWEYNFNDRRWHAFEEAREPIFTR